MKRSNSAACLFLLLAVVSAIIAQQGFAQDLIMPDIPPQVMQQDSVLLPGGSNVTVTPDTPAQESQPDVKLQAIDIQSLQQIAMQKNPTIIQAQNQIHALRGKLVQVGLYPNPNLGWLADEMGNAGTAGRQGLVAGQEFVVGEKLELNRAVVTQEISAAEANLNIQCRRVMNDVRIAAVAVQALQEKIRIAEQLVRIAEDGTKMTQQLVDAMEVSPADLLKAEIETNRTSLMLGVLQEQHLAAWQNLTGLIGCTDMQITVISGTLDTEMPQLDWNVSLNRLLTESPELVRAHAAVQRARYYQQRQCEERLPNINTEGVVAYNNQTQYTEVTVGITMPIKIYDRNQGNIMQAQSELAVAQREVNRIELALHNRLAQSFRNYNVARRQVDAYRTTLLPKTKKSLDLTSTGFQQGELNYLDLLTAQRTYFSISMDYISSLESLWQSAIEIEGMLLTGGLQAPATGNPSTSAQQMPSPPNAMQIISTD